MIALLVLVVRYFFGQKPTTANKKIPNNEQNNNNNNELDDNNINYSTVSGPPQVKGVLPYFGVWFEFQRDPVLYLEQRRRELGDLFSLYICGRWYHVAMDYRDHALFYQAPDSHLQVEGSPFIAVLGSEDTHIFRGSHNSVALRDISTWLSIFHKHVTIGLHGKWLKGYAPAIRDEVVRHFRTIVSPENGGRGFDLYHLIETLSINMNVRLMLGKDFFNNFPGSRENLICVRSYFERYAAHPFLKKLVLALPIPQTFRVRRAIQALKRQLQTHCEALYDLDDLDEVTLAACLKQAKARDVSYGPPRGMAITIFILLMTSTGQSPLAALWLIYELIRNPQVRQKVLDEQLAVRKKLSDEGRDPDDPMQWTREDYYQMKYLDLCIFEVIRMHQGVIHAGKVLRSVLKPQILKGFLLSPGDQLCLYSRRYHDNGIYINAESFIPERWSDPELQQSLRENPYLFSPFGHGAHMCPGMSIARVFLKAVAGEFVYRFNAQPAGPFVELHPPFTGINPCRANPGDNLIDCSLRVPY